MKTEEGKEIDSFSSFHVILGLRLLKQTRGLKLDSWNGRGALIEMGVGSHERNELLAGKGLGLRSLVSWPEKRLD
jgi:hypothetical protein